MKSENLPYMISLKIKSWGLKNKAISLINFQLVTIP
jgi:hypothetical protein